MSTTSTISKALSPEVKQSSSTKTTSTTLVFANSTPSNSTSSGCLNSSQAERKRKKFNFKERVEVWQLVYRGKDSDLCKLCCLKEVILAETSTWEIAHIVPWSLGGDDGIENLRPICRTCNRSMGNKHFKDFAKDFFPRRYSQIILDFGLA